MPILVGVVLVSGLLTGAPLGASLPGPASFQAVRADTVPTFRHAEHESVGCTSCHRMDPTHGASLVQSVQDCRSCHHTRQSAMDCAACHEGAEIREPVHVLRRTFTLTVEDSPSDRDLPFDHGNHEEVECAQCHSEGPSLAVPDLDCLSCHEEHHVATTECLQCHLEPAVDAHDRSVHVTCSGAACHQDVPVDESARSRAGCLWCHQEQVDHEPAGDCASCHLMPPPRSAGGGRGR